MLKKIRELFKIFKGVRSMIIIRCDNCGSINTELWKETLKNENIEINKKEYKKTSYNVQCKNCNSLGYIEEVWSIKR